MLGWFERATPIAFVVFSFAYLWITPPGQVPDEQNHFLRAYQISQAQFSAKKIWDAHYEERGDVLPLSLKTFNELTASLVANRKYTEDFRKKLWNLTLDSEVTAPLAFTNTVFYPPVPYLPQAFAIAVGRVFGARPMALFYLGRVANLAVATVLLLSALKLLGRSGLVLVPLMFSPKFLQQAGSLSPDTLTTALGFYLFALFIRDRLFHKRGFPLRVLLTSVIQASTKFSYFLLSLVSLVTFRSRVTKVIIIGVSTAVGLGWMLASRVHYLPFNPLHEAVIVDPNQQLGVIVSAPGRYLGILIPFLWNRFGYHLLTCVTGLGWGDVPMGKTLSTCAVYYIHIVAVFSGAGLPVPPRAKWSLLGVFVLGYAAAATLIYLADHVGSTVVSGFQGRYLIPYLPLYLYCLPQWGRLGLARMVTWSVFVVAPFFASYGLYCCYLRYY